MNTDRYSHFTPICWLGLSMLCLFFFTPNFPSGCMQPLPLGIIVSQLHICPCVQAKLMLESWLFGRWMGRRWGIWMISGTTTCKERSWSTLPPPCSAWHWMGAARGFSKVFSPSHSWLIPVIFVVIVVSKQTPTTQFHIAAFLCVKLDYSWEWFHQRMQERCIAQKQRGKDDWDIGMDSHNFCVPYFLSGLKANGTVGII